MNYKQIANDNTYYSYATLRQKEYMDAVREFGSAYKAANHLNVTRQTIIKGIMRLIPKAARMGYSPKHDLTKTVPDGFFVKGASTYYNKDGEKAGQWIKSQIDQERQKELIQIFYQELAKDIKRVEPVSPPAVDTSDLLVCYPFGDPHIGLHAWKGDAGEDYDLKIAQRVFTSAMAKAVEIAPKSEQCLIVNVGDYYHSDNSSNRTEQSGHALDVDSRFGKIARVGVNIMIDCIDFALTKHQTVTVINAQGNHDRHSAQWLSVALSARYHDEPRVVIPQNHSYYNYFTFGKNLIGITHGDKSKPNDLESIMATDKPKEWGESKYRYWYTGHVHHDQIKEYRGCKFESFRTLAAKDSWHAASGYRSGRDLKTIVLHKEFGEVERYTIGVDQFMGE